MLYPPTTTQCTDVIIVGAGPVGLATALWFGQRDHTVVLIEQYALRGSKRQRAFNQRHQQVGLDPTSLNFLNALEPLIRTKIGEEGCPHGDWINISIFRLQNILYSEILKYKTVTFLFEAKVESVSIPVSGGNARVIVTSQEEGGVDKIYSFCPELIVVCDGRHDDTGTAKKFFNFPSASRVTLSSLGIIGMISRADHPGTTCLANYSSDNYETPIGAMHVRLLGSLQERYIALGAADENVKAVLSKLSAREIKDLLHIVYDQLKDEHEPSFTGFTEVSKKPINIILDYRKETIKLLENSNTIVTVEGDAARKTTFFSGSGLNSAYKGLEKLFSFCTKHRDLIFHSTNLLHIDQILLEKDRESLEISDELLRKGIKFILSPCELGSCANSRKISTPKDEIHAQKENQLKESALLKIKMSQQHKPSQDEIIAKRKAQLAEAQAKINSRQASLRKIKVTPSKTNLSTGSTLKLSQSAPLTVKVQQRPALSQAKSTLRLAKKVR
jgi:2-polyprenyl-6-methoxyphenol hydroxylase-like FAD-dependent oxidoreductase